MKRGRSAEQERGPLLNDAKVRRWTGTFGVAGFVVFLAALPLYYLAGPEPRIEDTAATTAFVTRASTFILTRATLADPLIMIGFLVFLAGFRHTIRLARPDHEWVSTLVFGAGLVVIALELVGDALQAAAALDTVVKRRTRRRPRPHRGQLSVLRCGRTLDVCALPILGRLRHSCHWGAP